LKALIVIAHPDKNSIDHRNIVPTIKMSYKKKGHDVEVIDLYLGGYNPSQFVGDISNINNNAFARSYRDSLKRSDHIYIISPTRWVSLNPLIEGFIDQVFIKGFAFTQREPLLKGKKLAIVTTSTSDKSLKLKTFNLLWIRLRLIVFPKMFGFKNVKTFQIWESKSISRLKLNKKLLTIQKYIAKSFPV